MPAIHFRKDCGSFNAGFALADQTAKAINGYHLAHADCSHVACSRATAIDLLDDDRYVIISAPTASESAGGAL